MAAFYLKGVSPPHVSLNQIFLGMLPFMAIQVLAIFLLYMFPQIALWIPSLITRDDGQHRGGRVIPTRGPTVVAGSVWRKREYDQRAVLPGTALSCFEPF